MRIRAVLAGLALSAGILVPLGAVPGTACAAEQPRAALVVDTGSQVLRYCVALNKDEVSGIELVVLANRQHGLDYGLGFGGSAVCRLAGLGPTGDDCFEDYPNYWGYWRGDGSGGWAWSGSGAASTSVSNGDVEGWAWGSGDAGDTHLSPPRTGWADVCEPLSKPPPPSKQEDKPEAGREAHAGRDPAGPQPVAAPSPPDADSPPEKRKPGRRVRRVESRPRQGARVAQRREVPLPGPGVAPVAARPASDDGPPVAGLAGVAATAALAAGALVRTRRRSGR